MFFIAAHKSYNNGSTIQHTFSAVTSCNTVSFKSHTLFHGNMADECLSVVCSGVLGTCSFSLRVLYCYRRPVCHIVMPQQHTGVLTSEMLGCEKLWVGVKSTVNKLKCYNLCLPAICVSLSKFLLIFMFMICMTMAWIFALLWYVPAICCCTSQVHISQTFSPT